MKFRLLIIFFVFVGTVVVLPVAAQENTATPSATPTSTPSPTPSPTSSPTSSTSGNITSPTPTATPAAGVAESDKQKVLGEATVLGATGRQIQIAKIVLAAGLGFGVLVGGLRLLYENGQE